MEGRVNREQMEMYSHYISLGYFCEVAQDLEILGLRNTSSPFDWGISDFQGVINAINNEFLGFLDYENLSQNRLCRSHYHEDKYDFYFFHDFTQYKSLMSQYDSVKEKYLRRINRFLSSIKEPTLFVRYISAETIDENGRSVELKWIEENYDYILEVLKRYNTKNSIVLIGDETVHSDIVKVYQVSCDEGDIVSRSPILNNSELYPIFQDIDFPGKEENQRRYERKARKKRSCVTRCKNKVLRVLRGLFLQEYKHDKSYEIVGK